MIQNLLLTEGVQAGQHLGIMIMVKTDAADQELLVYLPDHRAGAAGLTLSHSDRHSQGAQGALNLHAQCGRKREEGQKRLEEAFKQGKEGVFVYSQHEHKEEMSHNDVGIINPHPL